jgi:hypothetical protein
MGDILVKAFVHESLFVMQDVARFHARSIHRDDSKKSWKSHLLTTTCVSGSLWRAAIQFSAGFAVWRCRCERRLLVCTTSLRTVYVVHVCRRMFALQVHPQVSRCGTSCGGSTLQIVLQCELHVSSRMAFRQECPVHVSLSTYEMLTC